MNTPNASPENQPGQDSAAADLNPVADERASATALTDLLTQLIGTGTDITTLLGQEVLLALGDSLRIAVLSRTLIHLAALAWLGFSVCISWIVFDVAASGPLAALTFLAVQVAAALLVVWMIRRYSASLTLPRTREHLGALMRKAEQK